MTRDEALSLADRILALVNAQPSTPSREDIASLLEWAPECVEAQSMTREEVVAEIAKRVGSMPELAAWLAECGLVFRAECKELPDYSTLRETVGGMLLKKPRPSRLPDGSLYVGPCAKCDDWLPVGAVEFDPAMYPELSRLMGESYGTPNRTPPIRGNGWVRAAPGGVVPVGYLLDRQLP